MSIKIDINSLTHEQRLDICNKLQFENENTKKWIYPYYINKQNEIHIPFSYAIKIGIKPKGRNNFMHKNIYFNGLLRDYQNKVKNKVIDQLNTKGSCVLSLHVGWGKSIFSLNIASIIGFKTLIIVHRLILIKQWSELIETVCPNSKYQFIKSKDEINPDCDFYLINAVNISKMGFDYFKTIGTVICDEIHLICAQTLYKCLFYLTPRYLLGLSATPNRPDGLDILIELYFGDYKIIKKLHKKHIVYAINTNIQIEYTLNIKGKMDWNSVLNFQAQHDERNNLITSIIQHFTDRHFLILCKRISQGEIIINKLQQLNINVTSLLGSKKSFDKDARVIVATTQKCGVGFSHDKLDALLLASDVQEYFIQYLGRVFRTPDTEPLIFDLIDNLSVLKNHYYSRRKIYKESGGIIKNIKNIRDLIK